MLEMETVPVGAGCKDNISHTFLQMNYALQLPHHSSALAARPNQREYVSPNLYHVDGEFQT